MPELPEVENLRQGLHKALRGRRIKSVVVGKPKLVSGKGNNRLASSRKARDFARHLAGDTFSSVERRSKNLIFKMKSGALIVAHLKMSGQFAMQGASASGLPNKHTHITFFLDRGALYYNDTRMFGYVLWYQSVSAAQSAHFQDLGPEPLESEFTLEYFREALGRSGTNLKAALMGQSVVCGLGNIYVDEACFAAGLRPDRRANSLKLVEVRRLHQAIRKILHRAVAVGGSSVSTYRLLDMTRGNYAREHKVYGRAGKPCVKCRRPLSKTTIQSRTTVFCRNCQR